MPGLDPSTQGVGVDAVYLDLSKAFDVVLHRILMQELEHLGLRSGTYSWIHSYLTDRDFCVRVGSFLIPTTTRPLWCSSGFYIRPTTFFDIY